MASQFSRTTHSLRMDSPLAALLAWTAGLAVLSIWLGWFLFSKVNVLEVSRAAHLEVRQSPSPVAAAISGKIESMALALGQPVRKGDVLVKLNATAEELRLREEQARLLGIAPRLASLHAEITALGQVRTGDQITAQAAARSARYRTVEAEAALGYAQENERRLRDESAAGSVAQIDALRAMSETQKLAASQGALSAEERRIEAELQNRSNQHRVQVETLRRAIVTIEGERLIVESSIERLKNDIEKHLVRSPTDGTVGEVTPLRTGAFVPEGQRLATVVPEGEMIIIADFQPSAALGRIRPGQISQLRLDGFPWSQFGSVEARVWRVATEIRDQTVRVELVPVAPYAPKIMMQHGLPGVVSVHLEGASPAALVLRAVGQMAVANASSTAMAIAPKVP